MQLLNDRCDVRARGSDTTVHQLVHSRKMFRAAAEAAAGGEGYG